MGSQTPCCGCPVRDPLWPRAVPAGVPRGQLRPLRSKRSAVTAEQVQSHAGWDREYAKHGLFESDNSGENCVYAVLRTAALMQPESQTCVLS